MEVAIHPVQVRGTLFEVITRPDLGELTGAWDSLLDRQPHPTPHLRSWWLHAGAKGQALFVLMVEEGRLIGGVAMEVDRWRGVRRARVMASNSWPSGFDLIAEADQEVEVVESLAEWMRTSPIKLFDLSGVLGDARLVTALPGTVRSEETGSAWVIELPSDVDQYLASKSRDFRRDVARAKRRIEDAGLVARLIPGSEIDRTLTTLKHLHLAQFGDESTFLPFLPEFAAAARLGVSREEVVFHELVDDAGHTVEIEVWLRLGDGAWGLVGGRDPAAVPGTGTFLRAWAIERFCEEGVRRVDLGGGYGYWKRSWATQRRPQLRVVASRGASSRVIFGVEQAGLRTRKRIMSGFGRRSSGPS